MRVLIFFLDLVLILFFAYLFHLAYMAGKKQASKEVKNKHGRTNKI